MTKTPRSKDRSAAARKSRRKGKVIEREAASLLRRHGFEACRAVQYKGGHDSSDLEHNLKGYHVEVSGADACVEPAYLRQKLEQAKRDARCDETPIVLWKRRGGRWHVSMLSHMECVATFEAHEFLGAESMRQLVR